MKKSVKFHIEIYSQNIFFTTCKKKFKKKSGEEVNGNFYTISDVGDTYIYCNDYWGDLMHPQFIRCLSHECTHAAMSLLGRRGVGFCSEHQEALAYLQDYILYEILNGIKKG